MAWYPAWNINWQRFRYWREQIGFESAYSKLKTECQHGENTGIQISIKWWVIPYLHTLNIFCFIFATEPNIDAIGDFIVKHGVKTEIV
ncbi:hypothetical protein [Yersinia pestis]|uniref:hypothetical protein n=1 Tax=Yersinia pestis TaxID=632 RepID=UPI0013874C6C|nr:hypothetical protein [Yersinia pestis]